MKPLFLLVCLFVFRSSFGMVICQSHNSQKKMVKITFDKNEAILESENSDQKLLFRNIQHSWDGHGAGLAIGTISKSTKDVNLAIKYRNSFGKIKDVVILADVAFKNDESGHYEALKIKSCTGRPDF